jgi:hypothetical protein
MRISRSSTGDGVLATWASRYLDEPSTVIDPGQ